MYDTHSQTNPKVWRVHNGYRIALSTQTTRMQSTVMDKLVIEVPAFSTSLSNFFDTLSSILEFWEI